jgi:hypothetical protein
LALLALWVLLALEAWMITALNFIAILAFGYTRAGIRASAAAHFLTSVRALRIGSGLLNGELLTTTVAAVSAFLAVGILLAIVLIVAILGVAIDALLLALSFVELLLGLLLLLFSFSGLLASLLLLLLLKFALILGIFVEVLANLLTSFLGRLLLLLLLFLLLLKGSRGHSDSD